MVNDPTPELPKTPPGWYPHPSMAATQRYWDGQQWTDHIAPMQVSMTTAHRMPGQTLSSQAITMLVVMLTLFFVGAILVALSGG